ncbi:MAG: transcription factor S [Candidatus Methanomethylophilaceae archaeon]|nr:transcription factor S [Candidatus Methanomethylophilaceae archaeon]
MFCSCGSMMFPENGEYVCKACGATKSIVRKEIFTTDSKDKETTVITENVATLPKTRIPCPECGHTEAYFVIRQTRAADEPETRIYRCCKCNHSWREY